jgi:glycine/D-amino acid oxidase-like deaminating enzyme
MTVLEKNTSLWQRAEMPAFCPLQGDTQADAVIVGAGLTGLLCAYVLYRKGVENIVLIDEGGVCGGVTAGTTAKITSQHGLIYHKLLKSLGAERAGMILSAHQGAIQDYGEIIGREKIDCGFSPCGAWVYTTEKRYIPAIEEEERAVRGLGFDAILDTNTELPFSVAAAIRFPHQAAFHPLQFAKALCGILPAAGVRIYTHTKASGAEPGVVFTDRGKIRAPFIISCTRYPFFGKHSLLSAKLYQNRSYSTALKNAGTMNDMYLDCAEGGFSFRSHKDADGGEFILFGAYDHRTGHEDDIPHHSNLSAQARYLYPQAEIVSAWSAQDCMTHDRIPYIGRVGGGGENMYIAAGFNKWGMTSAMAAANIITDLITAGSSCYEEAFMLGRNAAGLQAASFIKNAADIAGGFASRLLPPVKPVCTHMGCAVNWNQDEETWDCVCHGSRFDARGNVLSGPAQRPLKRLDG